MRLPRSISGKELAKAFNRLGFNVTRQTGSHMRLTHSEPEQYHITIPDHNPIKIGTLSAILSDVASHLKISRDELVKLLFE